MEIHEVKEILFFWHQVCWIFQLGKDPIFFFFFSFLGLCPESRSTLKDLVWIPGLYLFLWIN